MPRGDQGARCGLTVISLIAARARNNVIGVKGALPWHLPADFAWFKKTTLGKPVIMGRKTFESIGRPLPQRLNIVISRTTGGDETDMLCWTTSLEAALEIAKQQGSDEIMIIGGGELYRQAIPIADRLYLTEVALDVAGDAFFPDFDTTQWQRTLMEEHGEQDSKPAFAIYRYDRI